MPATVVVDKNFTGFYVNQLPSIHRSIVAEMAQDIKTKMQEAIDTEGYGSWPKLAQSTIDAKGHDQMLVETSQLRDEIEIRPFPSGLSRLDVLPNAYAVGWPNAKRSSKDPDWLTLDVLAVIHEYGLGKTPRRPIVETTYLTSGGEILTKGLLAIASTYNLMLPGGRGKFFGGTGVLGKHGFDPRPKKVGGMGRPAAIKNLSQQMKAQSRPGRVVNVSRSRRRAAGRPTPKAAQRISKARAKSYNDRFAKQIEREQKKITAAQVKASKAAEREAKKASKARKLRKLNKETVKNIPKGRKNTDPAWADKVAAHEAAKKVKRERAWEEQQRRKQGRRRL